MSSMSVRTAFAILLLFIATVEATDGDVSFWKADVTMKCPQDGATWYDKANKQIQNETKQELTFKYENAKKGRYHCTYPSIDDGGKTQYYYFYVRGRACENCFELNANLFAAAIAGDILMTAVVMMIIYQCTKKKSPAEVTHTSKSPARSGGRPQPASSSEYEQLASHTRTVETYSVVNRTG